MVTLILKVTLWSWFKVVALATLVTVVSCDGVSLKERRELKAKVVVTLEGDSRAQKKI